MTASTGLLTAFAIAVHNCAHALLEEYPDLLWEDAVLAAIADPPSFDWGGESPGDSWQRISGYRLATADLPRFRTILDRLDRL